VRKILDTTIELNKERDQRKIKDLEEIGWKTLTVWECEIRNEIDEVVLTIKRAIDEA
jgi:DNA mismatch endonuclease (patch repair protein)